MGSTEKKKGDQATDQKLALSHEQAQGYDPSVPSFIISGS